MFRILAAVAAACIAMSAPVRADDATPACMDLAAFRRA